MLNLREQTAASWVWTSRTIKASALDLCFERLPCLNNGNNRKPSEWKGKLPHFPDCYIFNCKRFSLSKMKLFESLLQTKQKQNLLLLAFIGESVQVFCFFEYAQIKPRGHFYFIHLHNLQYCAKLFNHYRLILLIRLSFRLIESLLMFWAVFLTVLFYLWFYSQSAARETNAAPGLGALQTLANSVSTAFCLSNSTLYFVAVSIPNLCKNLSLLLKTVFSMNKKCD